MTSTGTTANQIPVSIIIPMLSAIETLSILEGKLSSRVLALVMEWANLHKAELMDNWEKARLNNPLEKIEPLE